MMGRQSPIIGVLPDVAHPHRAVFASDEREQADSARRPPDLLNLAGRYPHVSPDAERMCGVAVDSCRCQFRADQRLRLKGDGLQNDSGAAGGGLGKHLGDGRRPLTSVAPPAPRSGAASPLDAAAHASNDNPGGENQCGRQNLGG